MLRLHPANLLQTSATPLLDDKSHSGYGSPTIRAGPEFCIPRIEWMSRGRHARQLNKLGTGRKPSQ
jgi:hypothetical protein